MSFIHDHFLLSNDTARGLYYDHAHGQPIYDYHCHLPPADLAGNRQFNNLFEAWLEGDHYKWRAMRANGIDEHYCTGDADPWEKFLAWARTVPKTLRNPLYHWTHLELKRYFDIDLLLSEDTAQEIWDTANVRLQALDVSTILEKFNVALIGTTDDPTDDLALHRQLHEQDVLADTAVYPAFRPDKAHNFADAKALNAWIDRLGVAAGVRIKTLMDLKDALKQRHSFFAAMGCRLSDHGLTHLPATICNEDEAKKLFKRARGGEKLGRKDHDKLTMHLMLFLGELDEHAGWTQQLHLGAMRNNNGWAWEHLGPDTGFDSIGDDTQGPGLSAFLGELARRQKLPRTVLYNLNPADNYLFAAMAGNFQDGKTPGKLQYGSGWWFLDQLEGMTWQINALSNLGLLGRFVGMLTDSRSFLSYPRHEYFRRLLCELIGKDVEAGLLPDDRAMLGRLVEDISFNNARDYFGMKLKGKHAP